MDLTRHYFSSNKPNETIKTSALTHMNLHQLPLHTMLITRETINPIGGDYFTSHAGQEFPVSSFKRLIAVNIFESKQALIESVGAIIFCGGEQLMVAASIIHFVCNRVLGTSDSPRLLRGFIGVFALLKSPLYLNKVIMEPDSTT